MGRSSLTGHLPGDKVRIKDGVDAGQRGVIDELVDGVIKIILDNLGSSVLVDGDSVQNYSLAARKAWKTNPHREGIGGRKPTGARPRLPVAFRVDPLVWDLLKEAEKRGLIANRTEAINQWILAGVTTLLQDVRPLQRTDRRDPIAGSNVINLSGKGN